MKTLAAICFILLLSTETKTQSYDPWFRYYNQDSTLVGFKNAQGVVKIAPRFERNSGWGVFDNIIAVQEKRDGKYLNYYLTKSGREVGLDSIHYFDNGEDYEQEGFIRFRDHKTDKVGLFNRFGDIVVPAVYDGISRVSNGLVATLSGAEKIVSADGEHHYWQNGKEKLIDTNNKVLIEDFSHDGNIDFHSVIISEKPNPDSIRISFKDRNGTYYSFIDYKKEFLRWTKTVLNDYSKEKLGSALFDSIAYRNPDVGWVSEHRDTYLSTNYEVIIRKLFQLKSADINYQIFLEELNGFIFDSPEFATYYDGRNDSKTKYPVLTLVFDYNEMTPQRKQDHFEFLRTDKGYKLISVTIAN